MSGDMVNVGPCCSCGCEMWIPRHLYQRAKEDSSVWFFCAYGHTQHYSESENVRLRRERDRLKQKIAERDDTIRIVTEQRTQTEKRLSATRGVVTRIKRRIQHGVCPCCTRSFRDLQLHMDQKHPEYAKEDA